MCKILTHGEDWGWCQLELSLTTVMLWCDVWRVICPCQPCECQVRSQLLFSTCPLQTCPSRHLCTSANVLLKFLSLHHLYLIWEAKNLLSYANQNMAITFKFKCLQVSIMFNFIYTTSYLFFFKLKTHREDCQPCHVKSQVKCIFTETTRPRWRWCVRRAPGTSTASSTGQWPRRQTTSSTTTATLMRSGAKYFLLCLLWVCHGQKYGTPNSLFWFLIVSWMTFCCTKRVW